MARENQPWRLLDLADPDHAAVTDRRRRRVRRGHPAKFKRPASYDIVEQLPRAAHGKLKKRLLRDPYWQ